MKILGVCPHCQGNEFYIYPGTKSKVPLLLDRTLMKGARFIEAAIYCWCNLT